MDITDSTALLKHILLSALDQKSAKNRLWTRKLVEATPADTLISVKIAKEILRVLSSRPFVLLVSRESVALYSPLCLHRLGVEKLEVPGQYQYYAMKEAPDRLLFRKKKLTSGKPDENAAEIFALREGWLELLPFEVRFLNGKLVLRAAEWLERLRLEVERDLLRIRNPEEYKRGSKKKKAALDYRVITGFDRVLIIDLLRKNFLKLTPKAEYFFNIAAGHVKKHTPKVLHKLILGLSPQNRYNLCPLKAKEQVQDWIPKD